MLHAPLLGIPVFPEFKALELSDRESIEAFTAQFPPYSDFNFTSMWCWDTQGEMRVSQLFGNLVLRFTDYMDSHPFYSFLGNSEIVKTTEMLLDYSSEQGLVSELKLIPSVVVKETQSPTLLYLTDWDNFDYILSVDAIKDYKGSHLMNKRNHANHFRKRYEFQSVAFNLKNDQDVTSIMTLCTEWMKAKMEKDGSEHDAELVAMERLFQLPLSSKNFVALGITLADKTIAFIISEIINNEYSLIHFQKADTTHKGVSEVLMQTLAHEMGNRGLSYMNYEQDLGILGLREGKKGYAPSSYLEKYRVSVQ